MKLSAKEVASELSNFVNNFNCDEDKFVSEFFKDHPTLVQKKIGLLLKVIQKAASGDVVKQTRNQYAIETCELVMAGYKKEFINHLVSNGWKQEKAEVYVNGEFFNLSSMPCI